MNIYVVFLNNFRCIHNITTFMMGVPIYTPNDKRFTWPFITLHFLSYIFYILNEDS